LATLRKSQLNVILNACLEQHEEVQKKMKNSGKKNNNKNRIQQHNNNNRSRPREKQSPTSDRCTQKNFVEERSCQNFFYKNQNLFLNNNNKNKCQGKVYKNREWLPNADRYIGRCISRNQTVGKEKKKEK
jgi:hypothetical protein